MTQAKDSQSTRTAKGEAGNAQHPAEQAPSPAAGDLPEIVAEAEKKGYFGTVPDQPPNTAYSMEGGAPQPISNAKLAADAAAKEANDLADSAEGKDEA